VTRAHGIEVHASRQFTAVYFTFIFARRLHLTPVAPHLILFPGIFLSLTVFGFNLFGDGLRDALDPRLNR